MLPMDKLWVKKIYGMKMPAERDYTDIVIGDNDLAFTSLQNKAQKFKSNRDTLTGMHISFSKNAKLLHFVKSLDILNVADNPYYIIHNEIWVFNRRVTSKYKID